MAQIFSMPLRNIAMNQYRSMQEPNCQTRGSSSQPPRKSTKIQLVVSHILPFCHPEFPVCANITSIDALATLALAALLTRMYFRPDEQAWRTQGDGRGLPKLQVSQST
jgi:hypothetical protein